MKKLIFGAMLLTAFAGAAQEKQQKTEGGKRTEKVTPEQQSTQLAKELGLDDKQKEKVKALYTEQEKQRAASKPEAGKKGEKAEKPAKEDFEAKMKQENEAFDKKMKGILTSDQYTKWQESQKKHKGKPASGGEKPQRAKKES